MRRYRSHEEPGPDGQVRILGEFDIAGMRIAWEKPPIAWIAELLRDRAVATRSVGLKGFDRPQPVVGFNPLANTATRAAASDGG